MRIATLLLLTTAIVRADDVVLTDGTIFHNATIVSHTATTASISFADGAAMVRLDRLDQASLLKVAKQPMSDSPTTTDKTAADIRANDAGKTASDNKAPDGITDAVTKTVKVLTKVDSRLVPRIDAAGCNANGRVEQIETDGCYITLALVFPHEKIVPHEQNVSVNIVPDGLGHTPVNRTETKRWTTTEVENVSKPLGVVFLSCPTTSLSEGGTWSGKVWNIGRHVEASGSSKPLYTANAQEAYAFYTIHPDEIPAPVAGDDHLYDTPEQTTKSLSTVPMK